MSEMPIGQGNAPESQGTQPEVQNTYQPEPQQQESTGNPAWNNLMQVVPSQLHSQVTPILKEWDQNYQQSIQKVHSEYEPYKAYEPFVQQGVDPSDIEFSLGLLNAISTNPQEVLTALSEWVAQENGQQVQEQGQYGSTPQSPDFDITSHPAYQELSGVVESMAQILLSQKEAEQQYEQDEMLEQELTSLKEKYGEFDEDYVLGVALNTDGNIEAAVQKYQQLSQGILSGKRPPGPPVLGSGGASPNTQFDPRKADSKDTKAYVASLLQQAAQQGH